MPPKAGHTITSGDSLRALDGCPSDPVEFQSNRHRLSCLTPLATFTPARPYGLPVRSGSSSATLTPATFRRMVCPPLIGQDFIPLMRGGRVRGIGTGAIQRQRTGPSRRDLREGHRCPSLVVRVGSCSCWQLFVLAVVGAGALYRRGALRRFKNL